MSIKPIEVGTTLITPGRTIGEGDVNLFAGLVGDFTPVHVDEVFAKTTPFGTRIAHGPLAMATASACSPIPASSARVIGLGQSQLDFPGPVKIGDTSARVTIEELRPTPRSGRNPRDLRLWGINQNEEIVQRGRMLGRRSRRLTPEFLEAGADR